MDKETFWKVIGEVNRCVEDGDQEAVLEATQRKLMEYSAADIARWHEIKGVYIQVLQDPDSLAEVEIPKEGADFEGYGYVALYAYGQKKEIETKGLAYVLKDYLTWIGSEGQTSAEGYLRVLEYRNDAYQEIDAHPLGEKEKDEILSEVELRPDISSCWNREMLPEIVPRLCWKYGVGQGMDMS